jgi:hypothetical protein
MKLEDRLQNFNSTNIYISYGPLHYNGNLEQYSPIRSFGVSGEEKERVSLLHINVSLSFFFSLHFDFIN